MGYSTDKFVINKGIDNEFILTIKQTGTTLPMEIANNELNKEITVLPSVNPVEYTPEVAYKAPVTEDLYLYTKSSNIVIGDVWAITITADNVVQNTVSYTLTSSDTLFELNKFVMAINSSGYTGGMTAYTMQGGLWLKGSDYNNVYSIELSSQAITAFLVRKSTEYFGGQGYIPEVIGKVEKYKIDVGTLEDLRTGSKYIQAVTPSGPIDGDTWYDTSTSELKQYENTDTSWNVIKTTTDLNVYDLVINDTVISLTYSKEVFPDSYDYLLALKDAIVNGTSNTSNASVSDDALAGKLSVTVDSNSLYLEGTVIGENFTVNGSNVYSIIEVQTATTEVSGQLFVEPQTATPVKSGTSYTAEVLPHYIADNTPMKVNLTELVDGLSITKIEIQPDVSVASVNDITSPTNGWYDVDTTTVFDVVPVTNNDKLDAPLDEITLRVKLTLTNSIDTFTAQLIKLSDDSAATTKNLSIEDAAQGKVKLTLTAAEVAALESAKGSKADRYYPKPVYRLVIDCDTINNGSFIAKVPEVYVE